jgi:NAD(P)-dependent dehydrogenase (short-subunit alcohol dehydrogenase family)
MELGLKARVAVISGGSRGIGKAIACGLAAEGAGVILLARGREQLERAADEIREKHGVRVLPITADVTSATSIQQAAERTKAEHGAVNIVVNNAGGPMRRMDRQILWPDTDWTDDLNLKIIGALRVTQAFLPLIPGDGTGRIINISGSASVAVWAPALTHALNNAAMNQATGYLAHDLAAQRITVNTVVPGLVGTEGRDAWAQTMATQQGVTKPEFLSSFCKRMGIISGRWAEMSEVADAVTFLASDRARYFNGSRVVLDGGLSVNVRPA